MTEEALDQRALALRISLVIGFELVVFAGVLFYGAGTDDWTGGWLFLILVTLSVVPATMALMREDPRLIESRMQLSPKGQPLADRVFVPLHSAMMLLWAASAGYDAVREGWSYIPFTLRVAAALTIPVFIWMGYLTMRQNPYLATVVCVQPERGHRVIDTGPYAIVRHPFYAVTIACQLSASLMLGSWLSLAIALVIAAMIAARVTQEERYLEANLRGYGDYMGRTPWRLIPGLW